MLVHDSARPRRGAADRLLGRAADGADDASHGGYIAGGISVSYTDHGANGQPALTTTTQHVVQVRRQQVEFAQEQSGTTIGQRAGGEPDPGGGQIRNGLDDGDWIAINRFVNLTNMNKEITFRFAQQRGGAATDRVQRRGPPRQPDRPAGHARRR